MIISVKLVSGVLYVENFICSLNTEKKYMMASLKVNEGQIFVSKMENTPFKKIIHIYMIFLL